ncbi:MAG: hypothetical protein WEB52_09240 [Dehalococcoidia bacterium]
MRLPDDRQSEVRVELVTALFVAGGTPEGIHDLGRFLENLNNPSVSRQVELRGPAVRPLYHATLHVDLDAPLLVRREDIVFATFDGPHFARGVVKAPCVPVRVLLMAPPFQISGTLEMPPNADPTQALRTAMPPFFALRFARVFDTDGVQLGEGEQIIVNGAAVQMQSATRKHIEAAHAPAAQAKRAELEALPVEETERVTRAA